MRRSRASRFESASGYSRGLTGLHAQVENSIERVRDALKRLYKLAQGGTAVGTGLNTKVGFAEKFAEEVAKDTGAVACNVLCSLMSRQKPSQNSCSMRCGMPSSSELGGWLRRLSV